METLCSTAQGVGTPMSTRPADAVRQLLESLGLPLDLDSPGLKDTPDRVERAWRELTAGYRDNPEEILGTTFPTERYDEMVTVSGVEFYSMCEHHLLPFTGTATVSYIPDERVVGLSKLARLVDCFARRLQIQERMTQEIAAALEKYLKPKGAGVHLQATHMCMTCRGVKKAHPVMATTALIGTFKTDPACRAEFLRGLR